MRMSLKQCRKKRVEGVSLAQVNVLAKRKTETAKTDTLNWSVFHARQQNDSIHRVTLEDINFLRENGNFIVVLFSNSMSLSCCVLHMSGRLVGKLICGALSDIQCS